MGAQDKSAQRKIFPKILSHRSLRRAIKTFLYFLPRLEIDKRLVLGRKEMNVPFWCVEVARIGDAAKNVFNALKMNLAFTIFGIALLLFQKPFDLAFGFKTSVREAFQGFLNNRGHRFLPYKHFAVAWNVLIMIADNRTCDPIAIHRTRPHAVHDLLGILLPLVLRDAGQKVFDKAAVGILAKLNRRGFQFTASLRDGRPQFQMGFKPTRKAAYVVNDDGERFFLLLSQESQHGLHARAVNHAARNAFVLENLDHIIILELRVFPAPRLLRPQPVPLFDLFRAGNAAIDNGGMDHAKF